MKVLIINPCNPQLNELTEELISRGQLQKCVHTYITGTSWIEKLLSSLPVVRILLSAHLGRRDRFSSLGKENFVEPVKLLEIIRVFATRSKLPINLKRALVRYLIYTRNCSMSRCGAKLVSTDTDVVVAAHGMAFEAFKAAERYGAVKVLDFPITHYRFTERVMFAEAAFRPDFAGTLESMSEEPRMAKRYDLEIEKADYVLVGSKFVLDSFVAQGVPAEKVIVVPYGVHVADFAPAGDIKQDKFNLLFVGQIGQRKGISYLLDAYKKFQKDDTQMTLVGNYVGDASIFDEYRDVYTRIAHMPMSEMPNIFRSGTVFVFPTLIEGMGLVVLEAMASGLPVVTTDCGPGEVVRDGVDGFILPARDVDSVVTKLEYLYNNPDLLKTMAKNARERSESFTWNIYTDKVVKFLERVLPQFAASNN